MVANIRILHITTIKVMAIILRNNLLSQIQYRTSMFFRFIGTFTELFIVMIFFNLLFKNIHTMHGWNYYQILILVCAYDFIRNVLLGCCIRNLPKLEDMIANGKLDLYLIKPINTQFYISFLNLSLGHMIQAIIPLCIMLYLINTHHSSNFSISRWIMLSLNLLFGFIMAYSLWITTMSLTFYMIRIKSLHELFLSLMQFGRYPSSIYSYPIKIILQYLFPILMIACLPIEIFFSFKSNYYSLILIVFTIMIFLLSKIFWNHALNLYESAGG